YARQEISRTFHGRDIFAPAAAHLALGLQLTELGDVITNPVMIAAPPPLVTGNVVHGEVIGVDRFGNLLTNISADMVKDGAVVEFVGAELRVVATYADAHESEAVALINSDGMMEIAMRDADAADTMGAGRGSPVTLRLL
ncbi:MAG: SAM hydrolase/SAM-dependent halogenase family protein, partial [Gemmatimonadota bacterium]